MPRPPRSREGTGRDKVRRAAATQSRGAGEARERAVRRRMLKSVDTSGAWCRGGFDSLCAATPAWVSADGSFRHSAQE